MYMYQREIIENPVQISRYNFIEEILYLGYHYSLCYDTILTAVQIGDIFCNNCSNIFPQPDNCSKFNYQCERIYSIELSHIATIISCKINEDSGYNCTRIVASDLKNNFVYKLEWEICHFFNFKFPRSTYISNLIDKLGYNLVKSELYFEITRDLCHLKLITINPNLLSLIIVWLFQKNKLSSYTRIREKRFVKLIININQEYDIDIPNIIKEINNLKK